MVFLIAVTFYKLREEASDAHNFARDVQNNAKRDHDEAEREKLLLKQREVPLIVQRGLALCEQGDIDRGLQWLKQAQGLSEEAQLTSFDRAIRANLTAWDKQLTPTQHIIQVPGGVSALAANPEGNTIASGGRNGIIRFWDIVTGTEIGRPLEHPAAAQVRPNLMSNLWHGATTASILPRPAVLRFAYGMSLNAGKSARFGISGKISDSLHFSADGQFLFAVSGKGGIRYRKTLNQGAAADSIGHDKFGSPVVCAPSRDGKWLATSGQNGLLRLWTKTLGRWITMQSVAIGSWVEALAWAGDDRQVILGCRDGKLFVWDLETKMLYPLPPQGNAIAAVLGTPDGRRFITSTRPGTVHIYDAASRTRIGQALVTESPIIALTCQRDTFAIGHEDGTIAILRLPVTREIGKRIHSSNGTADASISTVQFSKAGKWLLVAMSPRALLWETGPGSPKNPHTFEHAASTTAALSPDAQWVAFAGAAGTELFEVRTSQKIPLPDPIDKLQNLNEILFSPNSSRVVYLSSRREGDCRF